MQGERWRREECWGANVWAIVCVKQYVEVYMSAILIFIIVVSILAFWNIDAYVRNKNRFPMLREIFKLHIREQDHRAYKFFVYFSILLLCVFVYSIYTSNQYVEWVSLYISDVVLAAFFVVGLINYVFRMYIACISYGKNYSKNIIYVWDLWSIGVKDCVSSRQKIILFLLNMLILMLFVIYFVINNGMR